MEKDNGIEFDLGWDFISVDYWLYVFGKIS